MKKSILIELRAAVAIDDYVQKKDYVQSRIDDYSRGLKIFFNKIDTSKCDVVFVENTCKDEDQLPQQILDSIPKGTFLFVKKKNDYGKYNNGGGDIEMWKEYQEQIREYDYFFHYEPRMILDDASMIESFLKNPRNLFCIEDNTAFPCVKTGYFGVKVSDFMEYLDSIDLDEFAPPPPKDGVNIENSMRDFWETRDTDFQSDIKYCTRRWYDATFGSGYSKY